MPEGRIELRRGGLELPSRLIDDLYWLGRYTERGDLTARLLRSAYERAGSEASDDAPLALDRILDALQALKILPKSSRPADSDVALAQALGDPSQPASLCGLMQSVHALSQRTRGRLSRDAWQTLHEIGELIGDPARPVSSDPIGKLGQLLLLLSAVRGSTLDNMVRSHAWTFLDMGRRVERGSMTLSVLRAMLAPGAARIHMEVLLEAADSLLTYRARYLSQLQVAPVVDLLLTDDSNPRSVVFQATELVRHVSQLPRQDEVRNAAERRAIALQSSLLTLDVARACSGKGDELRQALEACNDLFWQFSDDVEHTWFSHTSPSHALAVPAWVDEELEAR